MERLSFADVTRLVNLTPTTRIDPEPVVSVAGQWAIYRGANVAPGYNYPINILYLLADCRKESMPEARAAVVSPRITQVIAPNSLWARHRDSIETVFADLRATMTVRSYLFNFLKDALEPYLNQIAGAPQHFVRRAIDVSTPHEASSPRPKPLINHFYGEEGKLGVLLAEPGEGKTYEMRQLAADLSAAERRDVNPLPIYVSSDQWEGMRPDDLADLSKTISQSFTFHGTPIGWILDNEKVFLSVCCKAGLLCILFDGFDEYIYRNQGQFAPNDIVNEVNTLVESSGAKVLLTSRSSFWANELADRDSSGDRPRPLSVLYHLPPFGRDQARTYFESRFFDQPEKRTIALDLYDALRSEEKEGRTNLCGRGFVLPLLWDLVERSENDAPSLRSAGSVTKRLIYALCEREDTRQKLGLTAEQQMDALRMFAEEVASGRATTGDLVAAITLFNSKANVSALVGDGTTTKSGSLDAHPLIRRSGSGSWRFLQDQVFYSLLGEQLTNYITEQSASGLRQFIDRILRHPKMRAEIASVIVDQAFSLPTLDDAREHLQTIIAALIRSSGIDVPMLRPLPERELATSIALIAVNHFKAIGQPRTERRDIFLSLFPAKELRGLQFAGAIQSISFAGVRFVQCFFDGVSWVNCDFNESTIFDRCRFDGGRVEYCNGFGDAEFDNPYHDPGAAMLITSEKVISSRRYSREDLKDDMTLLLRKFPVRENKAVGFLKMHNLRKGAGANSPHRDKIIDALFDHDVLDKHRRSDRDGGVHIMPEAQNDLIFLKDNGVFIGRVLNAFEDLCKNLRLR